MGRGCGGLALVAVEVTRGNRETDKRCGEGDKRKAPTASLPRAIPLSIAGCTTTYEF
ncbi:hypothetical protein KSF_093780 [Reticulibacter mediterranei]|uniref:Uncharacterized protein n=1 Tax=Reticulibacter mediterranei TaxID=2778369 RepID=A0A8J3IYW8_9CHLR|nr:hypothetical protein KSF_093780 [Reticulibacter mediterranei]